MYKNIFKKDLMEYLGKDIMINEKTLCQYSGFDDFQYQTSIPLTVKSITAEDLKNFLLKKPCYESVEVTGKGFVSVKFQLMDHIPFQKKKETIVVDYCGVNVAKKMHIGHIRSMFIGDYIARLHEKMGDKVVRFNHIGDWGNQFGYLLNYILSNNLGDNLNNDLLTQYYKTANELNKTDPVFSRQSEEVAFTLQHYDSTASDTKADKIYSLWQKCVDISLSDAIMTFKELDITLSESDTQGESFYAALGSSSPAA